jgi:hypothetical protein
MLMIPSKSAKSARILLNFYNAAIEIGEKISIFCTFLLLLITWFASFRVNKQKISNLQFVKNNIEEIIEPEKHYE